MPQLVRARHVAACLWFCWPDREYTVVDPSPERQRNLASEFDDIDSGSEPSHDAAEDAQDSEGDDFTPAVSADEESNGGSGICDVSTGGWSKLYIHV